MYVVTFYIIVYIHANQNIESMNNILKKTLLTSLAVDARVAIVTDADVLTQSVDAGAVDAARVRRALVHSCTTQQ